VIFVTVGTTAFDSLIREADSIAASLNAHFLCQIADGNYLPKHCQYFRFKPNLDDEYIKAAIVISHGGAGTLFELLKLEKKVIAVPNTDRIDPHQEDLINALSQRKHILACRNIADLSLTIKSVDSFVPVKYVCPECNIADEILRFIG